MDAYRCLVFLLAIWKSNSGQIQHSGPWEPNPAQTSEVKLEESGWKWQEDGTSACRLWLTGGHSVKDALAVLRTFSLDLLTFQLLQHHLQDGRMQPHRTVSWWFPFKWKTGGAAASLPVTVSAEKARLYETTTPDSVLTAGSATNGQEVNKLQTGSKKLTENKQTQEEKDKHSGRRWV